MTVQHLCGLGSSHWRWMVGSSCTAWVLWGFSPIAFLIFYNDFHSRNNWRKTDSRERKNKEPWSAWLESLPWNEETVESRSLGPPGLPHLCPIWGFIRVWVPSTPSGAPRSEIQAHTRPSLWPAESPQRRCSRPLHCDLGSRLHWGKGGLEALLRGTQDGRESVLFFLALLFSFLFF